MDIKNKSFYIIFFLVISILFLWLIINSIREEQIEISNIYEVVDSDFFTDKKTYQINDKIQLNIKYQNIHDEQQALMYFCLDREDNKRLKVQITQFVPPKYHIFFPKEYWIDNPTYKRYYQKFIFKCPKNLQNEKKNEYKLNLEFQFIKKGNKYFLISKNGYSMEINKEAAYYTFEVDIKEGLFSSEEINTYCLGKYFYMKVDKAEELHIFFSEKDICQ